MKKWAPWCPVNRAALVNSLPPKVSAMVDTLGAKPAKPHTQYFTAGAEAVRRLPEKWAQLCPIEREPRPPVGGVAERCAQRYNCNAPQSGSGPELAR